MLMFYKVFQLPDVVCVRTAHIPCVDLDSKPYRSLKLNHLLFQVFDGQKYSLSDSGAVAREGTN